MAIVEFAPPSIFGNLDAKKGGPATPPPTPEAKGPSGKGTKGGIKGQGGSKQHFDMKVG